MELVTSNRVIPGGVIGLRPLVRYGIAVAAAAVAVFLRLVFDPIWGLQLPYITFFPAIMVSAWLGGFWPGLVTTLLSAAAADYFFMPPAFSFALSNVGDLIGLVLFIAVGGVISGLNEAWRRATAAIGHSEERLRVTLRSIGDAVITTDERGRVTRLNAAAQTLTGWTETDAVGRPLGDVFVIVNEESRGTVENPVSRVLRDGKVTGLGNHTLLVSKDGREVPVDDSAAPITEPDGRIVGVVMVFRDISEQRRVERERAALLMNERSARAEAERIAEELRHIQAVTDTALVNLDRTALIHELLVRIRAALGSDTATVLLLDEDGSHLTPIASDGLPEEVGGHIRIPLGKGAAGRIAKSDHGIIIEDLAEIEVVNPLLRERLTSLIGAPLRAEDRLIGVIHAGSVTSRRFADADARLLSLVAERLALAIERARLHEAERTARVEAETAERRLQLALDAGRMGTWQWSIGSGDVKWSASLEAIHGFAPGSFPGTLEAVQNEIHPDDRERVRQTIADSVERGHEYQIEYRIVRSDGRVRWVEGRGQLFHDPDGRPERMIGVCSDITERRQAEEERSQLLAREQAAREELERASRLKDEFLAVLSHELRTPLNAVLGWAHLLSAAVLPTERVSHAVQAIERNAQAEARLVDSLLDLSRIVAGKLRLDRERVDLPSVVHAAVEMIRPAAEAKGVILDVVVASSPLMIVGDGSRLEQVVWNLLSNAVKFTPEGGRIEIRAARTDSRAQLQVSDTGQGISPEFLPYVFDRFAQADAGKTRKHGGLGLGLAIVREFVHAHGGTVVAESPGEGRGSTFLVTLPIPAVVAPPREPEFTTGRLAGAENATPSIAALNVLVVDDDADARDLLALTLESRGAVVRTVSSASEALDSIGEDRPDVLLADIGLPQEDGYMLIRKLRSVERAQQRGRLPAIAVTAYASASDREQAITAGYDGHLAKPVEPGELARAVARVARAEEV